MKRYLMILPMLSVAGCVTAPGALDAYCTASEAGIVDLAQALAITPDEVALRTGDLVIRQHDAACQ